MGNEKGKGSKQSKLLDRFLKAQPEFKSYKFDLAVDVYDRLEAVKLETGLTNQAVNEALNYAVRGLVTRLEREAGMRQSGS